MEEYTTAKKKHILKKLKVEQILAKISFYDSQRSQPFNGKSLRPSSDLINNLKADMMIYRLLFLPKQFELLKILSGKLRVV